MDNKRKIFAAIEDAITSQAAFGELLNANEKQILIDHGVVHSGSVDEILVKQGEYDRRIFIVVMGEVEIYEGFDDNKLILAHIKRGEIFGEISALFDSPRISSAVVSKPSVILIVPGDVFEKVITARVELYDAIFDLYKLRLAETALRSVDLFRHISKGALQPLIKESSIFSTPQGGVIVNEGESGDYFYIIIRGTARVSHKVGEKNINLALMYAGDYFGEWSVLTGAPRAATVSALDRVDTLRIDRVTMLNFIQAQPEIQARIDLVAHNRKQSMSDSPEQLQEFLQNIENVISDGFKE